MSQIVVPVKFSGTEGFPARRDGRYIRNNSRGEHLKATYIDYLAT